MSIAWSPRVGTDGDDAYNIPGAIQLDGSVDDADEVPIIVGTELVQFFVPPIYGGVYTESEISSMFNLNQIRNEINRRAWDIVVASGATIDNVGDLINSPSFGNVMLVTSPAHGLTPLRGALWQPSTTYTSYAIIQPTNITGKTFVAGAAGGTSGAVEPVWPSSGGVNDGSISWTLNSNWSGILEHLSTICNIQQFNGGNGPAYLYACDADTFIARTGRGLSGSYTSGGRWLAGSWGAGSGALTGQRIPTSLTYITVLFDQINQIRAHEGSATYSFPYTEIAVQKAVRGTHLAHMRKALSEP